MKKLRRATEAEVIAEFLKSEFHEREFDRDRARFAALVAAPDLTSEPENAVRRALLFRRRGHMWRELPADTQWWEVQLDAAHFTRVRVFPRAHWVRLSDGSFYVHDIVARMREREARGKDAAFFAKIRGIAGQLAQKSEPATILLIGVDERAPLTVLEGNHRLTAALLAAPELVGPRFRLVCGFSPRMAESCWYDTNLATLWRYARNRLRNLVDKEADVERVLAGAARRSGQAAGTPLPSSELQLPSSELKLGNTPWRQL